MGRTGLRRRRGWGRRGGAVAKRITRNSINVHTGEPTPENGKKVGHPRRDDFFVSEGHRPYAPGPRSPNAPRVPPRAPELGRRPGSPLLLRQTSPLPPQCPRSYPALSSNVGSAPAPGPRSNIALAPHPPQLPPCSPPDAHPLHLHVPPSRPRTVRSAGVCHTSENHGHAFFAAHTRKSKIHTVCTAVVPRSGTKMYSQSLEDPPQAFGRVFLPRTGRP